MNMEMLKELAAILALIVVGAGIISVLLKDKFRKPATFVTDGDLLITNENIKRLQRQFDKLDDDVRKWRDEIKSDCATQKDLTAFGEKVASMQSFHMTVHDNGIKALNRSSRAIREATEAKQAVVDLSERTNDRLDAIDKKMDELPERIMRLLGGRHVT